MSHTSSRSPAAFRNIKIPREVAGSLVWLSRICDCKHNNFSCFFSDVRKLSVMLWKCFLRLHCSSTGCGSGCLSAWELSLWKQVKVCKRGKGGRDNKWLPWPACWHFGLCSHNTPTCCSLALTSTSVRLSLFPHLHPAIQWSKMVHSNYSLVEPKIANNTTVGRVDGPVFASALPWQPGFACERLPFFFKCFFPPHQHQTNCPHQHC